MLKLFGINLQAIQFTQHASISQPSNWSCISPGIFSDVKGCEVHFDGNLLIQSSISLYKKYIDTVFNILPDVTTECDIKYKWQAYYTK